MTTNLQKLTLFCLQHQVTCSAPRSGIEILCEQESHVLSENYLQQKWDYCCSCQSFFARNDVDPAKDTCMVCDREIIARYLCDTCETMAFETRTPPLKREFSLSQAHLPIPVCPCCLKTPPMEAGEHACSCLKTVFKTARSTCPFCEDRILTAQNFQHSFPAAFHRPVTYYLNNLNGKAFRAGYSETRQNALAAINDGRFWMTIFQDNYSYLVFPGISQAESAQHFYLLQKLFDCDVPGPGELWIVAPAVALYDAASGEYTIAQKGKLEVHAPQTSPLSPPPIPFNHSQPMLVLPPDEPPPINTEAIPEMQIHSPSDLSLTNPSLPQKKGFNKSLLVSGVGLAALILIVVLVVSSASTVKKQILTKLQQGQMVSPLGDSAYDIYLRANLNDRDKAEIRAAAIPALENYGSGIVTKITRESYEPSNMEIGDLIRVYTWLEAFNPTSSFYKSRKQYFQGWQYYQNKDYKNAGNEFTQAMNSDTGWALPVNKLAHVALRYKDYYAAQNWYQKASERDPKWIIPFVNLGMLAIGDESKVRNYPLAEEAARKALALDPNKASAHYILGRALEGQGRSCEALSAYRNAVQSASNISSPGFNVSNVNKTIGQIAHRVSCAE